MPLLIVLPIFVEVLALLVARKPLHVGVSAVGRGGDEVCHPHGGHVLAMDMGDRGARAHGEKRPRHWPDEGMPRPEAKGS